MLLSPGTDIYRDRVVMVTGATGFIGAHLCRRLATLRAQVHALSRQNIASSEEVRFHRADVSDGVAVHDLMAAITPDIVFHLASRVTGSRALAEVMPTFTDNLVSTLHLLQAVTNSSCKRMVLAGSLEESAEAPPSSPYAAAKAAASSYARMFHRLYGTPITIARLFMVYGPGQHDDRKLVPYVATSLLKGETPRLSSGVRPVDWVYIDDVVDTLIRSAITPELNGATIDVGTGQLTTVRSVAEQIGHLIGGRITPVFGAIEDRQDEQVRAADPTTARSLLGRSPTSLHDGLKQTIDWYRAAAAR